MTRVWLATASCSRAGGIPALNALRTVAIQKFQSQVTQKLLPCATPSSPAPARALIARQARFELFLLRLRNNTNNTARTERTTTSANACLQQPHLPIERDHIMSSAAMSQPGPQVRANSALKLCGAMARVTVVLKQHIFRVPKTPPEREARLLWPGRLEVR